MLEILPLLIFTTCGGVAAGAYVMSALSQALALGEPAAQGAKSWLFPLVCVVLLGVGLLGTLAHLGQPLRFMNGMSNPASMVSQESYWSIAFGIVMLADGLLAKFKGSSPAALRWIGAALGCGLMVVMGLAYHQCAFIPAWTGAITLPVFIVGDLAMGCALCLLFAQVEKTVDGLHAVGAAVSLAWLAVIVGYGVHLLGTGEGVGLLVAGAVAGPVAAAVASALALRGKLTQRQAGVAVLVLTVVGVLFVRSAFFAAGVL